MWHLHLCNIILRFIFLLLQLFLHICGLSLCHQSSSSNTQYYNNMALNYCTLHISHIVSSIWSSQVKPYIYMSPFRSSNSTITYQGYISFGTIDGFPIPHSGTTRVMTTSIFVLSSNTKQHMADRSLFGEQKKIAMSLWQSLPMPLDQDIRHHLLLTLI